MKSNYSMLFQIFSTTSYRIFKLEPLSRQDLSIRSFKSDNDREIKWIFTTSHITMSQFSPIHLITIYKDTQKRFGPILKTDSKVRMGIKNTRHYHWTYPCRSKNICSKTTQLEFYNMNTIDCVKKMQQRGFIVAAMNIANPDHPKNWENGVNGQEESLMYRSTYPLSLDTDYGVDRDYHWSYPLKEIGGVYSPDNLVFKDRKFENLSQDEMFYINFVAISGIRFPEVNKKINRMVNEYDVETMKEKMRAFFRICNMNGVTCPVIGSLGCDIGNPPEHIGLLWREIINEPEFRHMFDKIVFSIAEIKNLYERIIFEDVPSDYSDIDWDQADSVESDYTISPTPASSPCSQPSFYF